MKQIPGILCSRHLPLCPGHCLQRLPGCSRGSEPDFSWVSTADLLSMP